MNLSPIELFILYRQAIKEENEERQEKYDTIKQVSESWSKNFKVLFENLQLFVNPTMFKILQEEKELALHRTDLSPDNFDEEWAKMMQFVSEEVVIEEPTVETTSLLPSVDDDIEEMIAGWVSHKYKPPEIGGD